MKAFYKIILRYICRRIVLQGPYHRQRITEYYKIIRKAAESEFTEDNKPTLDHFLKECFDEANKV